MTTTLFLEPISRTEASAQSHTLLFTGFTVFIVALISESTSAMKLLSLKEKRQVDWLMFLCVRPLPCPSPRGKEEEVTFIFRLAQPQKEGAVFPILWFLHSRWAEDLH